ncbi:chromosome loss- protein [Emydomyces testavorans]|uniref:Chromosome loss- protein n=1 Tax=Emydomyces testavorans TaxID=2070801 RepID=A0AAF0II58_9EURO|nr:chromosome loss- protein [Emydomyces testavorans]
MARRSSILAPSAASLPDTFRIPANTASLIKSLSRLSRTSLVDLVLQWLDDNCLQACRPYLIGDAVQREEWEEDDDANPYEPATSIEALREVYTDLRERKGGKREVIDRILEGDWRNGLTLRQLAMADVRYIEDHPAVGHRWTALQLVPNARKHGSRQKNDDGSDLSASLPRFHGSTFLKCIQNEISPLVKAHYYISRSTSLPLTFVRIFIIDSPYQYPRQSPHAFTDASRVIYLVFPDSAPFIYSSLFSIPAPRHTATSSTPPRSLTTDTRTLRRIVMDAIPKALSRPHQRYTLKPTSLTTKSLHTLLALRGPGRTNTANGAFSIFADAIVEQGPLDPRLPNSIPVQEFPSKLGEDPTTSFPQKENISQTSPSSKRAPSPPPDPSLSDSTSKRKRQKTILSRFGTTGCLDRQPPKSSSSSSLSPSTASSTTMPTTNPSLEKLEIRLQDPITPTSQPQDPDTGATTTTLSLTFSGSDVISGLRQLADLGVIDVTKMPAWMTGEEGVSSATIRNGRRVLNDHG